MPTKKPLPDSPFVCYSYFHKRIIEIYGATEHTARENGVWATSDYDREPADAIVIAPGRINGEPIIHERSNGELRAAYQIIRRSPVEVAQGKPKYKFPTGKNKGTYPFFPRWMEKAFTERKEIPTLILTEGYLKAFKAGLHGAPVVGLGSITHYKDHETGGLYRDVVRLIQECKVRNVVVLYDADCTDISRSAFEEKKDLFTRPNGFYSSAINIREKLNTYDVNTYFAHVNKGLEYEAADGGTIRPKGLDDLLVAEKGKEADVIADLLDVSTRGKYFYFQDITTKPGKLGSYLGIRSPKDFYQEHAEFLGVHEFIFRGTHYKYNPDAQGGQGELEDIIPAEAKNFALIGNDFYEKVMVPDKYGNPQERLERRVKSIIELQHGKKFITKIPQYKAFCNVPDHLTYQQVIHNCYNRYFPFGHQPEEGDIKHTLDFLGHIFGEQIEEGLDYLQLMYQRPSLPPNTFQPILCLVSEEQATGKSTFAKWLKAIYDQNMAIVGNEELSGSFNEPFAGKLVVCCEESFIEKKAVVEKLKALATADKMIMNAKNRDHVEISFFGRIILLTNNVENFIYADDQDTRYWVRDIPSPPERKVRLLEQIIEEIPAFLYHLDQRKMKYPEPVTRFWLPDKVIRTDAFTRLVEGSRPLLHQDISEAVQDMFAESLELELNMSIQQIVDKVNEGARWKHQKKAIKKTLEKQFGVEFTHGRYEVTEYTANGPVKAYKRARCGVLKAENFLSPAQLESLTNAINNKEAVPTQAAISDGQTKVLLTDDLPF